MVSKPRAGNAFVLDETALARQADGLLVETLGVERSLFDAGDLGADQRRAVSEILGAVMRPYLKLPVMRSESFQVRIMLVYRGRVAVCRPRKRRIKAEFSHLKK